MRIIQSRLLVLISTLLLSKATLAVDPISRVGGDLKYEVVKPEGYNLTLSDIVAMRGNWAEDASQPWWHFGQNTDGVVNPLSFEVRDARGIISVHFTRHGDLIFMEPPIGSKGYAPILFAVLGPARNGDEDTGRNGENLHQPIEFKIPGLVVVNEISLRRGGYSLLLPKPAEEVFITGTTEAQLSAELVQKRFPLTAPEPMTIVVSRSVDESIDISPSSRRASGFAFRLFNGFVPLSILTLLATQSHDPRPFLAVGAVTLPLSLARFTFSKRSRNESSKSIAFSQAGGWSVVAGLGGMTCAMAVKSLTQHP